jgi:hypothetical protein
MTKIGVSAFDPLRTFDPPLFTDLKQVYVQDERHSQHCSEDALAQDWDHYLCALGDNLASIYLDLAQTKIAPVPSREHSTMVSVAMLRPQENGMSSDDEFDDLIAIEDDLAACAHAMGASYVGRLTTQGRRIFYLYSSDPEEIEAAVRDVLGKHSSYLVEVTDRPDPEWSTYLDFLYPREADYQRMMNRRLN